MGQTGHSGDRPVTSLEVIDILAVGAHPDDVELGCGATLATLSGRGRSFGILDLTRGEAGTRGTPEKRAKEAARAAQILGARFRETLDLGDGALRTDREAELLVIDVIRRHRPRLVLAPWGTDRHPDHVRTSRLATEAAFYAGLRTLATGYAAHRPQQVVYYPSTFVTNPAFLVDVSERFAIKLEAIRAYRSQFHVEGDEPEEKASDEPETVISSRMYFEGIAARARAFGALANVPYAEAFLSPRPPLLTDPIPAFEGFEPGFSGFREAR